jgi:hypothetical protein
MKPNSKSMRAPAERAAEWYCRIHHDCTHTVRAVKSRFNRQDLFASDCVGKKASGAHVYIQVTAGQASAVTARRRKLEAIPWHESDTVELIQLVRFEEEKEWRFRINVYDHVGSKKWWMKGTVVIDPAWWRAYKGEEE